MKKEVFTLRCKSNYCPKCYPKNKWILEQRIFKLLELNKLDHFLTLTLDPKKIPDIYINNTHKYITTIWHKLTNRLRYYYKDLKYIWVIEFQSIGNAHMHLLCNKYLPIKYLRKNWINLGGGSNMKIEKIKSNAGMSFYVSKYVSKFENTNRFYYMERRWGCSRSCERGGGYKSW